MIFRKPFEENFIGKAPNYGYPFISTPKLQSKLERIARRKGKDVTEMVNQLLRKDVKFLEELT
jgi:hypothetical protein